jgi:NDP-sugar pyrophosphorylase family protein
MTFGSCKGKFMENRQEQLKVEALYRHPEHSIAYPLLSRFEYPWQALGEIADYIRQIGQSLSEEEYDRIGEDVWVAKTAKVAPSASISGPCIICDGAEVRHCAFIRGSASVGAGAVVGNSTELKNCILFDGVQVPHYNYVGDSILGYKSHMGAGAIASNFRLDHKNIVIKDTEERYETGLRKMGVLLGDFAEVGCGSVLCPGTVIGRRAMIYPLSRIIGTVAANTVYKDGKTKPRRDTL